MGTKGMLSCLTALLLFFSQGVLQGTKAENNKIITKINLNRGLEYGYQSLDMKTLFNMSEERSNEIVWPLDSRFITFMFEDYTMVTIPCMAMNKNLVKDTEKATKKLTSQQISLSTLKELLDDKSYNDVKDKEWVRLYMNLADDSVVASSINYEEVFFVNEKYIDKNFGDDTNLIDFEFSFLANRLYFAAINEIEYNKVRNFAQRKGYGQATGTPIQ